MGALFLGADGSGWYREWCIDGRALLDLFIRGRCYLNTAFIFVYKLD